MLKNSEKFSPVKYIIEVIIVVVCMLVLWKLIILIWHIPQYLFPGPEVVARTFIANYEKLLKNMGITLLEIVVGFSIANILSILLALYIFTNKKIERYLMPLAISAKTMPLIAIIPLILIWFGSGISSKIIAVILICFFPSLISMIRGIRSINADTLELFNFYAKNDLQKIRHLVLPFTLPYLFSALKISSSLAVVGALVGELIAANKGLGFVILTSYYRFDIAMVFVVVIITCLIGIVFYYSIQYFEHKLVFWTDPVDD